MDDKKNIIKKICPECGRVYENEIYYCPMDGTRLDETNKNKKYKYYREFTKISNGLYRIIGKDDYIIEGTDSHKDWFDIRKIDIEELIEETKEASETTNIYLWLGIESIKNIYDESNDFKVILKSSYFHIPYLQDLLKKEELENLLTFLVTKLNVDTSFLKNDIKRAKTYIKKYNNLPDSFKIILECDD